MANSRKHKNESYDERLYNDLLLYAESADRFAKMLETKPAWMHEWLKKTADEHIDYVVWCLEHL